MARTYLALQLSYIEIIHIHKIADILIKRSNHTISENDIHYWLINLKFTNIFLDFIINFMLIILKYKLIRCHFK